MRKDRIIKTDAYIQTELMKLAAFPANIQRMAEYRIEHSRRVARIAAEIARKEGFDEERAYVSGLLHDIGYSIDYATEEDARNHGRCGARIARPFLLGLGYSEEETNEMCFGIAIHVDDKADFDGERTPLALTVGDADNIDRFDAFRLYEGLHTADYRNLPLAEQVQFVAKHLTGLEKLRQVPFGTKTASLLWQNKIDFQLEFFRRLQDQIDTARPVDFCEEEKGKNALSR